MINDPAIQHPPYSPSAPCASTSSATCRLPGTGAAPPRPRRRPGAAAPGDVGVAGEGRRHRVVQGPAAQGAGAAVGAGVGRAAAQPVAQRPARHDGLHRGGPDPGCGAPSGKAATMSCSNGAATLAPKSPDWGAVRTTDPHAYRPSVGHADRPGIAETETGAGLPGQPPPLIARFIERAVGVAAAFQDVPDNPGGSGAHHTGLHPGLLRPQPGTPRQAAAPAR